MDPSTNQLIQEIRNSDSFKVWIIEKAIQGTAFYNEEHAVYAYVYELAHGSPMQYFWGQPHEFGMFLIHVGLLLSARSPVVSTRYFSRVLIPLNRCFYPTGHGGSSFSSTQLAFIAT